MAYEDEKKGKGCLFYGCLTFFIMGLIIVGVIGYGAWKLKNYAMEQTEEQPLEFTAVDVSEEAIASVKEKIETFSERVKSGSETATLTLTDEEINTLLYSDEQFRNSGIQVEIDFTGDKATGQVSLPLGIFFGGSFLQGRYLNGEATFNISGENGVVVVTVDSFKVRGEPLPEVIMQQIRSENLAKGMYENPESIAFVKRIKHLEVKNGKLFIEVLPGPTMEGRSHQ